MEVKGSVSNDDMKFSLSSNFDDPNIPTTSSKNESLNKIQDESQNFLLELLELKRVSYDTKKRQFLKFLSVYKWNFHRLGKLYANPRVNFGPF